MAESRTRRGRRPLMAQAQLLAAIRRLDERGGGLFKVHRRNGRLYSRARRQFGSWSAAVNAAGLDYGRALAAARQRSLETRRRVRRRREL